MGGVVLFRRLFGCGRVFGVLDLRLVMNRRGGDRRRLRLRFAVPLVMRRTIEVVNLGRGFRRFELSLDLVGD